MGIEIKKKEGKVEATRKGIELEEETSSFLLKSYLSRTLY